MIMSTTVREWVQVARVFHLDWLRYGSPASRLARNTALQNARYAQPNEAKQARARQLAEGHGRDWSDLTEYDRLAYHDLALASRLAP